MIQSIDDLDLDGTQTKDMQSVWYVREDVCKLNSFLVLADVSLLHSPPDFLSLLRFLLLKILDSIPEVTGTITRFE